jgi:hypothetical protein
MAKTWQIPTNALNGTIRRVTIMDADGEALVDFNAAVTVASGVFSFTATDQGLTTGILRYAFVDNYDGNTATTDIRGGVGIATLMP